MKSFINAFTRISNIGAIIGGCFLAIIMLIVVASIIVRPFGKTVPGSYEMIELFIVVTIAFAYTYTALKDGHISVGLVVNRFKPRTQAIITGCAWIIGLVIWALITWSSTDYMLLRWLGEQTELLDIPFLPFRMVWSFGMLLFCIALAIQAYNSFQKAARP